MARAGDCGFEVVRLRDRPLRHVTAVRPSANAKSRGVGDSTIYEILHAPHHILEVAAAPVAAVHFDEFLAVAARAPNVGIENRIAVRRQELAPNFDGVLPVACRSSMNQCDKRQFIFWIGSSGLQESCSDLKTVE